MGRVIHAAGRTFEVPPYALGDRVIWTPPEHRVQWNTYLMAFREAGGVLGWVLGINLKVEPSCRLFIWLDEATDGGSNGFKCAVEDVRPLSVVDALAALGRSNDG